jgi:UDP-glucose 4-epimerase
MHILITGATGFVGSALSHELKKTNNKITLVTRKKNHDERYIYGNCNAKFDWCEALDGVDVVVHCAGVAHKMENTPEIIQSYYDVNTHGSINLATQASNSVKLFIFLSSVKVHGEISPNTEISSSDNKNPLDDYAKSKLFAEEGIAQICKDSEMNYIFIRPPLISGIPLKGNLKSLSKLINLGIPLPFGSLKFNKRAMISIENLVDFVMVCMNSKSAYNQEFLVCDAKHYSTLDIMKIVSKLTHKKLRVFRFPVFIIKLFLNISGNRNMIDKLFHSQRLSIKKNKDILNWKPLS